MYRDDNDDFNTKKVKLLNGHTDLDTNNNHHGVKPTMDNSCECLSIC